MNKEYRHVLFCVSIIIFAVASAILIIFALGYQYDFVNWKLEKTGSLQLRANVSAEIYINDKLVGTTSFFTDSFTDNRLLPRNYNVKVQSDNFEMWQKDVDIKAGLVTDFPKVVLIPKKLTEEIVASSSFSNITSISFDATKNTAIVMSGQKKEQINLNNGKTTTVTPSPTPTSAPVPGAPIASSLTFSPLPSVNPSIPLSVSAGKNLTSPDGVKKIWFTDHEIWVEWLKDSGYQPFNMKGFVQLITRFSGPIKDIQWHKDSNHFFVNIGGLIIFIEIDTRGGLNSYSITTTSSPFYYSLSANAIFKFEGNKLVRIRI